MPKTAARRHAAKPAAQDASILVQIAQLAASNDLQRAINWIWSEAFISDYGEFLKKHPRGSDGYRTALTVAIHYETIGTLWKHRLINEDLLFDWLWVTGVWDRMKGFVLGGRRELNEPALGENFQKMANAQARWRKQRSAR